MAIADSQLVSQTSRTQVLGAKRSRGDSDSEGPAGDRNSIKVMVSKAQNRHKVGYGTGVEGAKGAQRCIDPPKHGDANSKQREASTRTMRSRTTQQKRGVDPHRAVTRSHAQPTEVRGIDPPSRSCAPKQKIGVDPPSRSRTLQTERGIGPPKRGHAYSEQREASARRRGHAHPNKGERRQPAVAVTHTLKKKHQPAVHRRKRNRHAQRSCARFAKQVPVGTER
ncbi:uncharacterized protein EDB91DRAFT_1079180 [Suillus paluster]|uniref:uncharacterized protein n=1 Tax=Suillus paluster TaxID=48578 RepID=UPI001B85C8C0|nr:uncharacterized protein EDB91DRAFT_1079180 [Suillus paluster]KAG1749091.1 hypothetical protein EDB91DRAFT_1079180 [Suillus paluster]